MITGKIIEQTLRNHISSEDRLCPHGWVILGHSGNRQKLREDYEKELKSRFGGDKHYILSMARMFCGRFSSYILLEQNCSERCHEMLNVESSILVPAISGISVEVIPSEGVIPERRPQKRQKPTRFGEGEVPGGRAAQVLSFLKNVEPDLNPKNVKFRVQVDEKQVHDFDVDWMYAGPQFMVFSERGIRERPTKAAMQVFGSLLPRVRNIAIRIGTFVDYSHDPPIEVASYRDAELHVWLTKGKPDIPQFIDEKGRLCLSSRDARQEKRIRENILNRRRLWRVFIEKKRMTTPEFHRLSSLKPKAIAGFMHFLTNNRLAIRFGNIFVLNEAVIPEIQKLLDDNR